ncbi:glycosyltransferase family 2 protein [Tropicimonas sp.]|uniref:glycosyltransferase family 2 protein n=1 Tax=Tropicimonas sp. TaxID=2067044 RepID=UPI003A85D089
MKREAEQKVSGGTAPGEQGAPPDLTFVVPVHNAEAHLPRLVRNVSNLGRDGLRCQMVFVDDASSDGSVAVLKDLAGRYPGIELIESPENRGAGLARNAGWARAAGRYTIFFDADDILHGDVIHGAIADMDADPELDTVLFAYRYEREETASFTDMGYEDKITLAALLQGAPRATGDIEDMGRLLVFTNYPWNKILRTAHFRQAGMRFGKTRVNNDILGHWHSLLLARRIMVRDAIICTHIVHPQGGNITNSSGRDRLQMFEALDETYDLLEANPHLRRRFAHFYWILANRLVRWARPRLDPDFRLPFEMRYTDLLMRLDLGDLARMRTRHSPDLACALVNHLIR